MRALLSQGISVLHTIRFASASISTSTLRFIKGWHLLVVAAIVLIISLGFAIFLYGRVVAATAPTLGTAQSFAVLGASTVTNTGPTVITGNLGVSPGTAVTGFPPGVVIGGIIHANDAVADYKAFAANGVVGGAAGTATKNADRAEVVCTAINNQVAARTEIVGIDNRARGAEDAPVVRHKSRVAGSAGSHSQSAG